MGEILLASAKVLQFVDFLNGNVLQRFGELLAVGVDHGLDILGLLGLRFEGTRGFHL